MQFSRTSRILVLFAAVALAGGCGDSGLTDVDEASLRVSPWLVECPSSVTRSATRTLGILGGTLEVDGHQLRLLPGAVLLPTEFTMTVPASRHVEVHVTANGAHGFAFLLPATFTISYDRCTRNDIDPDSLTVYKIDPSTKTLLKKMSSSLDLLQHLLTFPTDSLSAYSIAQ